LIGDMQNQLVVNKDKLKLGPEKRDTFGKKLKNANNKIQLAAREMGVSAEGREGTQEGLDLSAGGKKNPFEKFISLLGDSQYQLENVQDAVVNLRDSKGMIEPAKLLSLQTKLGIAQRELEYSSVLLSKAVDGIKQIFNIQI
jgi:hypothetical protein